MNSFSIIETKMKKKTKIRARTIRLGSIERQSCFFAFFSLFEERQRLDFSGIRRKIGVCSMCGIVWCSAILLKIHLLVIFCQKWKNAFLSFQPQFSSIVTCVTSDRHLISYTIVLSFFIFVFIYFILIFCS